MCIVIPSEDNLWTSWQICKHATVLRSWFIILINKSIGYLLNMHSVHTVGQNLHLVHPYALFLFYIPCGFHVYWQNILQAPLLVRPAYTCSCSLLHCHLLSAHLPMTKISIRSHTCRWLHQGAALLTSTPTWKWLINFVSTISYLASVQALASIKYLYKDYSAHFTWLLSLKPLKMLTSIPIYCPLSMFSPCCHFCVDVLSSRQPKPPACHS